MPLTEILVKSFRWMSSVWRMLRRQGPRVADRHRLDLGSIPARIEAEKLSITIGAKDVAIVRTPSSKMPKRSSTGQRRRRHRDRR